ncbi:MAG: Holliday junction branch migration protein RuvA [Planctomycetota bacterium]
MLERVRGTLQRIDGLTAEIDIGPGIALAVALPAYARVLLEPQAGKHVELWCRLTLEGQAQGVTLTPRLLGFPSRSDRDFFELFTSVRGLGARKAQRAMASPPSVVAGWIVAGDTAALKSLPEVGKKLAETLVTELRDKAGVFADLVEDPDRPASVEAKPGELSEVHLDAVLALVALGESRSDAERLIERTTAQHLDGQSVETLVALALASRSAR